MQNISLHSLAKTSFLSFFFISLGLITQSCKVRSPGSDVQNYSENGACSRYSDDQLLDLKLKFSFFTDGKNEVPESKVLGISRGEHKALTKNKIRKAVPKVFPDYSIAVEYGSIFSPEEDAEYAYVIVENTHVSAAVEKILKETFPQMKVEKIAKDLWEITQNREAFQRDDFSQKLKNSPLAKLDYGLEFQNILSSSGTHGFEVWLKANDPVTCGQGQKIIDGFQKDKVYGREFNQAGMNPVR